MGIAGLLPFLEKSSKSVHLSELKGFTAAVDSYCWLHRGAFSCCEKLAFGQETNGYVVYCMKYIKLLQYHDIKPVMVFDGQHLPAKLDIEVKRKEQRENARKRATELLRLGKKEEARSFLSSCVNVSHKMALALIKECRKIGVDCIVAPYEADAQLAYLNKENIVDFVITEDSDLMVFGCKKVLFKLDLNGTGTLVESDKLYLAMQMRPDKYTIDKFRYMCILSGCDYISSLTGIGLKRALKFVKMLCDTSDFYNELRKLPAYLNMRHLPMTEEYKEEFMIANATFLHQLVYNPLLRKLTYLNDPESLRFCTKIGEFFDEKQAFQMAVGNVDPMSLKIMDDWSPDKQTLDSSSIWSRNYVKFKPKLKEEKILSSSTKHKSFIVQVDELQVKKQEEAEDNQIMNELKAQYSVKETKKVYSKLNKYSKAVDSSQIVKSRFFQSPEPDNLLEMMNELSTDREAEDSGATEVKIEEYKKVNPFSKRFCKRKRSESGEEKTENSPDAVIENCNPLPDQDEEESHTSPSVSEFSVASQIGSEICEDDDSRETENTQTAPVTLSQFKNIKALPAARKMRLGLPKKTLSQKSISQSSTENESNSGIFSQGTTQRRVRLGQLNKRSNIQTSLFQYFKKN